MCVFIVAIAKVLKQRFPPSESTGSPPASLRKTTRRGEEEQDDEDDDEEEQEDHDHDHEDDDDSGQVQGSGGDESVSGADGSASGSEPTARDAEEEDQEGSKRAGKVWVSKKLIDDNDFQADRQDEIDILSQKSRRVSSEAESSHSDDSDVEVLGTLNKRRSKGKRKKTERSPPTRHYRRRSRSEDRKKRRKKNQSLPPLPHRAHPHQGQEKESKLPSWVKFDLVHFFCVLCVCGQIFKRKNLLQENIKFGCLAGHFFSFKN